MTGHKNPSGGPDAFTIARKVVHSPRAGGSISKYHVRKCGIRYFIETVPAFRSTGKSCHWSPFACARLLAPIGHDIRHRAFQTLSTPEWALVISNSTTYVLSLSASLGVPASSTLSFRFHKPFRPFTLTSSGLSLQPSINQLQYISIILPLSSLNSSIASLLAIVDLP